MIRRLAALLLVALAGQPAGAIELSFPLDCVLGETCFLQQYADRDPGPAARDHRCGPRTYDGHKGTDIMLPSRRAMRAGDGVAVLAAAPGVVVGLRDGMADVPRDAPGAPPLDGRDCGNGVMLRHADGWTTQYCHMREGSVAVDKGDRVARGARLGAVGISGNAVVPHLHLTVRNPEGDVVDPYDARPIAEPCDAAPGKSLWADPLLLAYRQGAAVGAGVLDRMPDYAEVKDGGPHAARLPAGAGALVFWALFIGLEEGDRILLRLAGPEGTLLVRDAHTVPRDRAMQFRAAGRRAGGAWPTGTYRGQASLVRDGVTIDRITARSVVE